MTQQTESSAELEVNSLAEASQKLYLYLKNAPEDLHDPLWELLEPAFIEAESNRSDIDFCYPDAIFDAVKEAVEKIKGKFVREHYAIQITTRYYVLPNERCLQVTCRSLTTNGFYSNGTYNNHKTFDNQSD